MAKKTKSTSIQKPVRIPHTVWPSVVEAMEYDGITSFSQFALASITQRVRRILREKQAEDSSSVRHQP